MLSPDTTMCRSHTAANAKPPSVVAYVARRTTRNPGRERRWCGTWCESCTRVLPLGTVGTAVVPAPVWVEEPAPSMWPRAVAGGDAVAPCAYALRASAVCTATLCQNADEGNHSSHATSVDSTATHVHCSVRVA